MTQDATNFLIRPIGTLRKAEVTSEMEFPNKNSVLMTRDISDQGEGAIDSPQPKNASGAGGPLSNHESFWTAVPYGWMTSHPHTAVLPGTAAADVRHARG